MQPLNAPNWALMLLGTKVITLPTVYRASTPALGSRESSSGVLGNAHHT